jgi:hypothetical protein
MVVDERGVGIHPAVTIETRGGEREVVPAGLTLPRRLALGTISGRRLNPERPRVVGLFAEIRRVPDRPERPG